MTKLKTSLLVVAGFVLGFLTGDSLDWLKNSMTASYQALDHSITLTHLYSEQENLRAESDVLKAMAETHWKGMSAEEAKDRLQSLDVFDFAKGSEGFAAGPVFIRLQDGNVSEIQAHCARLKSDGCKDEGVN